MSQTTRVSKNNTTITREGATTRITLHNTTIVVITPETITLNSGGWMTSTTKTRMNQVANEYGLPYYVHQQKGLWFVTITGQDPKPFIDGMTITR